MTLTQATLLALDRSLEKPYATFLVWQPVEGNEYMVLKWASHKDVDENNNCFLIFKGRIQNCASNVNRDVRDMVNLIHCAQTNSLIMEEVKNSGKTNWFR